MGGGGYHFPPPQTIPLMTDKTTSHLRCLTEQLDWLVGSIGYPVSPRIQRSPRLSRLQHKGHVMGGGASLTLQLVTHDQFKDHYAVYKIDLYCYM